MCFKQQQKIAPESIDNDFNADELQLERRGKIYKIYKISTVLSHWVPASRDPFRYRPQPKPDCDGCSFHTFNIFFRDFYFETLLPNIQRPESSPLPDCKLNVAIVHIQLHEAFQNTITVLQNFFLVISTVKKALYLSYLLSQADT